MPLSFSSSGRYGTNPRVYLPGYKSFAASAYNDALQTYTSRLSSASGVQQQPDPNSILTADRGAFNLNSNQIINASLKAPGYAVEAPLRPLDTATGGLIGNIAKGVTDFVSHVPVVSNILGGIGEGLNAADRFGRGTANNELARALHQSIGLPDNARVGLGGVKTAGQVRREALDLWNTDLQGNSYTLQQLESMAAKDEHGFGNFASSKSGVMDMVNSSMYNPLNLLLAGGAITKGAQAGIDVARGTELGAATADKVAAGVKYLNDASKAYGWARPVLKPAITQATPYRYGYGLAQTMGRGLRAAGTAFKEMHDPNPFAAEFLDTDTAARVVAEAVDGVQKQGYYRSLLQAFTNVARKVYFPGVNTELKGARLVGSAARAWIRGGIQQQAATIGAEYLTGAAYNALGGSNNDNFVGNMLGGIHDMLTAVNNDHPLSDNQAFQLAAMFTPYFQLLPEQVGAPGRYVFDRKQQYYVNRAAEEIKNVANSVGGQFKSSKEFLTALGRGDLARGQEMANYFTDYAEIAKAKNQFSQFYAQVQHGEMDSLAQRTEFFRNTVMQNVKDSRKSGAFQPRSTADYLMEMHKSGGMAPKSTGKGPLASEITPTAESFISDMQMFYDAVSQLSPGLNKYGLELVKGGILTKEIVQGIKDKLLASDGFDQNIARRILTEGPSLVYDQSGIWPEFAVSLGQKVGGKPMRSATVTEGITKQEVADALDEVIQHVPSEQELFHEPIRMAKATGTIRNGALKVKDTPYPLGAKLRANRAQSAGHVTRLSENVQKLTDMRAKEFNQNGTPKIGASQQITAETGGLFEKQANGSYARADGVALNIADGRINIDIPANREADLLAQQKKTIFQSGPNKGSIKPGQEALSQQLNTQIEDARLGIDREAIVLGTQGGGRIIVADVKAGPRLADLGYHETARIDGSTKAAYSWQGGSPSELLSNASAGAFQDYRPTKRIVKTENGAVSLARHDAMRSSLLTPAVDMLGNSPDPVTTLFPEERMKAIQAQKDASIKRYKDELKRVSEIDSAAFNMLPFDKKLDEMNLSDWVDPMSKSEYERFTQFMQDTSEFPQLSLQPGLTVDPAASRLQAFVQTKNRWQDIWIDYGPFSPIARLNDAILAPIHQRWLGKMAQKEVHNNLASVGWSSDQSEKFFAQMREFMLASKMKEGWNTIIGAHRYPSVQSIPESFLQKFASDINPGGFQAVLDKYGSYSKMLTESSNRLMRTVVRAQRSGAKVNPILAEAKAMQDVWQYAPGFKQLSGTTHWISKEVYPWVRFTLDPLFSMMNWFEPYIYTIFNQGFKGLRKPSAQGQRLAELSSTGLIPPGGLTSREVPTDLLMADPGTYTVPQNIRFPLERDFENTTRHLTKQYFEAMVKDHPIAQLLQERFGADKTSWVDEMQRLMVGLDKNPKDFIRSEWNKVLKDELGYTDAELKQFVPVAERLSDVYRGVWNDKTALYVGRFNRSNLERLANSFFVLWPTSYMIKATKWMYNILYKKIGPVPGAAGAYAWDHYRQMYEQELQHDPNFQDWVQQNQEFIFAVDLLMPITPDSVGLSLARPARTVGSWVSDQLYQNYGIGTPEGAKGQGQFGPVPHSIGDVLGDAVKFGPYRSGRLINAIGNSWQIPGFYSQPKSNNTLTQLAP